MLALGVLLGHLGMTGSAVDFRDNRLARATAGDVHAGVTLRAGNLLVLRMLDVVQIHRHRAAIPGLEVFRLMAVHAVGVRHALAVENLAHLMGLMAVDAGWKHVGFLLPQLALDHLPVHIFDAGMTAGAGLRDIPAGDGGRGVRVRADVVRGVTRCAVRSNDEALLQQALAMDRFRVILENVILVDVPLLHHRRAFLMALAAGERHVQGRHGREGVLHGADVVHAVARGAAGGERIPPLHRAAVEGRGVLFHL